MAHVEILAQIKKALCRVVSAQQSVLFCLVLTVALTISNVLLQNDSISSFGNLRRGRFFGGHGPWLKFL